MLESKVHVKMAFDERILVAPGRAAQIETPTEPVAIFSMPEQLSVSEACALFASHAHQPQRLVSGHLLRQGDFLKGIKVLDMSNAMAGPIGAWWLAQYGAEVIKSDLPSMPSSGSVSEIGCWINQGKKSILNDMTTARGREVFSRLVKWADVVTHNVLDDTAHRLGLSHSQLKAKNPNLVSAQMSGFGGNCRGGWENRVAYDFTMQAASGMMAQYGSLEAPHIHGAARAADVVGGFTLAFGVLVGLWQQKTTGYAGECRTSLALANDYCQLPYMIAENGESMWGEAHGQFALGDHVGQRLYQCSDGWIFVGTKACNIQTLVEVVTGALQDDEQALESCFRELSCDDWLRKLEDVDIAAHKVLDAHDLYVESSIRDVTNGYAHETASDKRELLRCVGHPSGASFLQDAATWVQVGEEHSCYRLKTGFRYGDSTEAILTELGYSDDEIKELIRLKVSHTYLPPVGSEDTYFFKPENAA